MDSNWSQQGSLDWGQLAHLSMTLSVEVISRLSKAGVEPLTVAMGQAICSQFRVPADSQDRVSQAVKKLKAVSSYGDLLWFGFGVKHIIRSLAESEQGISSVGLCGCLSVSFDPTYSAQVLRRLAQERNIPGILAPSIAQWRALISVCSGSLLASHFPNMVEGFSRLWCESPGFGRLGTPARPTAVEALVKAIDGISNVSNGSLASVTITGESTCAWLAALSEWLFSLHVRVVDQDGKCLYQKFNGKETSAQVIIIRHPGARNPMAVTEKTFSVPSGESFLNLEIENADHLFGHGRSTWDTILLDTFGSSISGFFKSSSVGGYLTSRFDLLDDRFHFRFGGPRAIVFALEKLPELRVMKSLVDHAGNLKADSGSISDSAELGILNPCGCFQCRSTTSEKSSTGDMGHRSGVCHTALADTIVEYTEVLMRLKLDESIQPSSTGLSLLYRERARGYGQDASSSVMSKTEEDDILRCLRIITGFAARRRNLDEGVSAISWFGVTAFYTSLRYPDHAPGGQIIIQVIPGHIESNSITYTDVRDLDSATDAYEGQVIQPIGDEEQFQAHSNSYALELMVRESLGVSSLFAGFVWRTREASASSKPLKAYGSAELSHALLKSVQNYTCHKFDVTIEHQTDVLSGRCDELSASIFPDSASSFRNDWAILDRRIYQKQIDSQNKQLGRSESFQTAVFLNVRRLPESYSYLCSHGALELVQLQECLLCSSQLRDDYIVLDVDLVQRKPKRAKVEVALLDCQPDRRH